MSSKLFIWKGYLSHNQIGLNTQYNEMPRLALTITTATSQEKKKKNEYDNDDCNSPMASPVLIASH